MLMPLAVPSVKSNRVLIGSLAGALILGAASLIWLCALLSSDDSPRSPSRHTFSNNASSPVSPAEFDLYEPVVRFLLPRAEAAAGPRPPVAYVSLPEGDSAEQFCRRFQGQAVAVKAWPGNGVPPFAPTDYFIHISQVSGKKAQWENPDQARVFVRDYSAAQLSDCGTPYPIRLRRESGRWVIVQR
jgi:hypothetical protein